jgi:hypothetical protein
MKNDDEKTLAGSDCQERLVRLWGCGTTEKQNMNDIDKTGEAISLQNDPNAQFSICWANANSRIGMLTWNDGEMKFEGNADEAAREFLRYLAAHAGLKLSLPNKELAD